MWWAERYHWRSDTPEILPKGYELQDVVQQVIVQTICGERKWDPEKGSLRPWLKDQVKSVIDALAKSASHKKEAPLFNNEDNNLSEEEALVVLEVDGSDNQDHLNPEETLIDREHDEERKTRAVYMCSALFNAVEGDYELEEVLEAIIDDCEPKRRFLAEKLNVPVENIDNRLKRLRRKAILIKEEK